MDDDLEDLESMRRRIREEGRVRREEELRRRREADAARRRRRERASSASSASSRDLLLLSSPSPPPSETEEEEEDDAKISANIDTGIQNPMDSVGTKAKKKQPSAAATMQQNQLKSNNNLDDNSDSESSSDVDLSQMSKQLAERKKQKQKMAAAAADAAAKSSNSKNAHLKSAWWSDESEDEDEMDVRQLVAKQAAEKRKREEREAALASQKARADYKPYNIQNNNKQSAQRNQESQEKSSDKTPKFCNKANINDAKPPPAAVPLAVDLDKTTADNASSKGSNNMKVPIESSISNDNVIQKDTHNPPVSAPQQSNDMTAAASKSSTASMNTDAIIGKEVRNKANVEWTELKKCLLVRTVGSCSPKDKVAGLDLDQTLVNWRCAGWPSRPEHYELWNSNVIEQCRQLHDEGYKLVIFSNQGGIKSALNGKKAGTVKGIIDWIAKLIDRPLYAVCSTKKDSGYHKGNATMWEIMEDYCNCGKKVRPELSFYVGDADGKGNPHNPQHQQHQQTGTDKLFAQNVGRMRKTKMAFHTPNEYFGPSNIDSRRTKSAVEAPPPMSNEVIRSRTALLGGYLDSPILLILVGVQGSGKSTFCKYLTDTSGGQWCSYSQDTIRNGSPGTRQAVEEAAKEALNKGKNVVIDRMHLDQDQRRHFIQIGQECKAHIHALVMLASKGEVEERVKNRTNHPGKVEGDNGARIAVSSLSKLVPPSYDEGFELISYTRQVEGRVWKSYAQVDSKISGEDPLPTKTIELYNADKLALPLISLGTMNMSKHTTITVVGQAVHNMGLNSIDTAPTYGNESEVGSALQNASHVRVTIKVPKRATSPKQAREEVMKSLSLLQRSRADIILLHWPCDFIETGTLNSVWKELEAMKKEGLCLAIGVSNFNIMALKQLLSSCTIKPALNQVERHPLLPQYDLMEYCESEDIVVQSHSPLGNGSKVLLDNETIVRIAQENKMSPAQGKFLRY